MFDITAIALTLFLIANPTGNIPVIMALISSFSFEDQRRIVMREAIFALLLALFFQFFGEVFLSLLNISTWSVGFCGGTLLTIVALKMIFTSSEDEQTTAALKQEPYFVPIATPIITGPGTMAMIMLFSRQESSHLKMTLAILLAWIGVISVMASGPYLQRLLGKRGMAALQQLMGMLLAFMAINMIVNAAADFLKTCGF